MADLGDGLQLVVTHMARYDARMPGGEAFSLVYTGERELRWFGQQHSSNGAHLQKCTPRDWRFFCQAVHQSPFCSPCIFFAFPFLPISPSLRSRDHFIAGVEGQSRLFLVVQSQRLRFVPVARHRGVRIREKHTQPRTFGNRSNVDSLAGPFLILWCSSADFQLKFVVILLTMYALQPSPAVLAVGRRRD